MCPTWGTESVDVTTLGTVAELQELLVRGPAAAARERAAKRVQDDGGAEISVPETVSTAGKRGLAWAQRAFYQRVLATRVKGVPVDRRFSRQRGREMLSSVRAGCGGQL